METGSSNLSLTRLTKICISSIKNLSLNKSLQGLLKSFLSSDVDSDGHEVFFFLRFMGTSLAVKLVAEHSLKGIFDDLMSTICLQEGLYFLHQLICNG